MKFKKFKKPFGLLFAAIATIGTLAGAYFTWLGYKKPVSAAQPRVEQRQTGDATTKGPNSPAITGDNNKVEYEPRAAQGGENDQNSKKATP